MAAPIQGAAGAANPTCERRWISPRPLLSPDDKGKPEWAFLLRLENLDWNCPQHITPRFTAAEIEIARSPLRARIAAQEAENQALRTQMADANSKEEHL